MSVYDFSLDVDTKHTRMSKMLMLFPRLYELLLNIYHLVQHNYQNSELQRILYSITVLTKTWCLLVSFKKFKKNVWIHKKCFVYLRLDAIFMIYAFFSIAGKSVSSSASILLLVEFNWNDYCRLMVS